MRCFLLLLTILFSASCWSQKSYKKDLAIAERYFKLGEYANAIEYFTYCYEVTPSLELAKEIAVTYELNRNFKAAEIWYRQLVRKYKARDYLFPWARMMRCNGKYEAAIVHLEKYIRHHEADEEAKEVLSGWNEVEAWREVPGSYLVENLRRLNSEYGDVCATAYKNSLVFSSSRKGVFVQREFGKDQAPYFDLYKSDLEEGKWNKPYKFSSSLNSADHEGACSFSSDFNTVYFTRSEKAEKVHEGETDINPVKLYKSTKTGVGWSRPYRFVYNDSLKSYGHPSIASDGNLLFFASNRDGGFGGTDIYLCVRVDSLWSDPINLGPEVNTSGDECFPFIHESGDLFFASNGHPGLGGFDVFKVNILGEKLSSRENLRYPVNSCADDFGLFLYSDGQSGFVSSNRKGGKGDYDIYLLKK